MFLHIDHCTADGRADYYFLNVGEVVEAKIKPMRFERHGDCNNEATVAEVLFDFLKNINFSRVLRLILGFFRF